MSHHFKQYHQYAQAGGGEWVINYPAHGQGPHVAVTVPESGVWDNQAEQRKLKRPQVKRLAEAIGGVLDAVLDAPDI